MIDTRLVQEIIEKEISPDFEIYKYFDTEPYVIIFWKHKKYNVDDERGQIVGAGPVIFDKQKKEYRLLGSGEWFYGDYADLIKISEEQEQNGRDHEYLMSLFEGQENDNDYTNSLIEKLKSKIIARQYVNSEEVDYLSILSGARRIGIDFEMTKLDWDSDDDNLVVIFNNHIAQQKLIEIWNAIDFEYKVISDSKLLLWKTKPAPNSGFAQ